MESVADAQLSTLRPVTTYTVPPSTSFNTAPVSFYPPSRHSSKAEGKQKADGHHAQEEGSGERITVVGVQRGEGVKKEQEGKVIWAWRGEEGIKSAIIVSASLALRVCSCAYASSTTPSSQYTISLTTAHRYCAYTPTGISRRWTGACTPAP